MNARGTLNSWVAAKAALSLLFALGGCPPPRPEGDGGIGDLRYVERGAPRCTNDTLRCVQSCESNLGCDARCLELDLAPTESVAIGWVNCRTCVLRQRDVCAAEHGCAPEVSSFVACSDVCRGDVDCINARCPGARSEVDRCSARVAGGMCLTTSTHPAVFACFGLRPPRDGGG